MNLNRTYEVLNASLRRIEDRLSKQGGTSQATVKGWIKVELKKHKSGVSKEELLVCVEEVFGKSNFKNGKYQGGKELIITTIEELFGKTNFKDGKFTGGWNSEQDTAHIHKVFGSQNFTNGEYTGGWNKQQDNQNLKQSLENGEAKTLTSNLIEQKLGGSEKFQDGIYQPKPEIVKSVLAEMKPQGAVLKEIHNIFGSGEFYPMEGGEGVPPGREGCRKNAEEIAMMQAQEQKKIRAIEEWDDFFDNKHFIADPTQKKIWMDKFPGNPKAAENVYKEAILKGESIVGEDFTRTEEDRINKAKTPEEITAVLKSIPSERRKKAWENFFTNHDTLGNIKEEWKDNWRNSNLSIEVAKLIYNNGWYNSPNGLINNDKIIVEYTTETLVMGKPYPQTTKGIETLKHLSEEVDKVHEFIVKRIETETNLDKFPSEEEIKSTYQEKKVPDTRSWAEVGKLRDNRIKSLFKQYFQNSNPTKLTDLEIEKWRVGQTGLPNTGKDQRQAYDNGWTNPAEIKTGKITYQNIENIEVLKVKKADIDAEISKVDNLVKQINSYKYLRDLDKEQANIDKQFKELQRSLLPPKKDQEITTAIDKQREKLRYYLTDPKDYGLEETNLKRLSTILSDDWKSTNYEPITVDMLNKFIMADPSVQALGLFKEDAKWEDLVQSGWLKEQGGYELPKDKTNAENKLHRDQKGAYLLKFFYDKARDGDNYPFDPDKLKKGTSFCRIGKGEGKRWKPGKVYGGEFVKVNDMPMIGGDKGMAGHLPIGTGIGKTTKLINCLVQGGARHIILVCPTPGLVESAVGHHTSWLQRWGCVYHGGAKNATKMAFCRKDTYTEATDEEIAAGKAEKVEKNIYVSHGSYPVAKNDLAYWYNANTGKLEGTEEGKKGLSVLYFGNVLGNAARNLFVESKGVESWSDANEKQKVKEKLIPKEDTIVVFDEAHFNDAGYQALQFEMINAGYQCLRMSATFPKTEFSATSTYPMTRMFSGKLDPNMPAGVMKIDNAEQAEIIENMRGLEPGSIKFQDENGLPIPLEVNLEERIRAGKTWYFSKSLQLNPEQLKALGDKVKYTIYGEQYDENCEDVSFGQPYGSLGIVDGRREMGFTPDIDTVICSGATETTNLGIYFTYSNPVLGFTPISSLVQQMGRCGRIKYGLAITLTKECMEMDISDNVSAAMVKACFDGNIKQIHEKEYKQIYDVDILRGALSYPDPKTFGKAPEELLIGLRITKDQQNKKEKITKLDWRKDTPEDWKEAKAKPWYKSMDSSINPSEDLWNRYLGKSEKVTMDEKVALNTLKEMIANFIAQDSLFPQGLDMKKQEKMIGAVFGEKLALSGGKEKVIHETRTVLNGLVGIKIDELANKDYDESKKCSKNPNTIKKLAGLYKLADAQIDYKMMQNNEGKEVWTLLMKTVAPVA